jgi:hypothetical protein
MSSIQENKRIARRFLELVGEHKVEELCVPAVAEEGALSMRTWACHLTPSYNRPLKGKERKTYHELRLPAG